MLAAPRHATGSATEAQRKRQGVPGGDMKRPFFVIRNTHTSSCSEPPVLGEAEVLWLQACWKAATGTG
jgi:hypothetical protein